MVFATLISSSLLESISQIALDELLKHIDKYVILEEFDMILKDCKSWRMKKHSTR